MFVCVVSIFVEPVAQCQKFSKRIEFLLLLAPVGCNLFELSVSSVSLMLWCAVEGAGV